MPPRGRPAGAAGRSPRRDRPTASRQRRARASLPSRTPAAVAGRRRRTALTARAAVLAVALASVALALALPFKVWLSQRGEITALEAKTRQQQAHVQELTHQQELWRDPAYVQQQARVRLHYVMPGEKAYVVLGAPPARASTPRPSSAVTSTHGPWYGRLWQSVQLAGASAK